MTVPSDIPITIFVINMKTSLARRETMIVKAKMIGIEIEFIEAIVGKDLSIDNLKACYDSSKRKKYFGRDLMPQEIGCLLSHKKVYEEIVARGLDAAIILEDDVVFESDFVEAIRGCLEAPVEWDMIRFLSRKKIFKKNYRTIYKPSQSRYELVRIMATPGGAYGYMLSQNGARTLLQHMKKIWLPIDAIHGRVWKTKINCLALYPSPLFPDLEEISTIGDTRFIKDVQLTGCARLFYPITRATMKIYEAIGKRWGYYARLFEDKSLRIVIASKHKLDK